MPGAVWFEDWRLNFAENLLRRRDEHPALVFLDEAGTRRELSYADLYHEVGAHRRGPARLRRRRRAIASRASCRTSRRR